MTSLILIVSAIITIILIASVFIMQTKKDKNNKLRMIKQGKLIHKVLKGKDYWYKYNLNTNNSKKIFYIQVLLETKCNFKISKETKFDRFFIKRGIASKIMTNEPEFDDKFYISSNNDRFTRDIFSNSKNRRIVKNIFREGFTDIILKKSFLTARIFPYKSKDILKDEIIESTAESLQELSDSIKKLNFQEDININRKRNQLLIFLIPVLIEIIGLILITAGFIKYTPLDTGSVLFSSLKYTIPISFIFLWWVTRILKGKSTSHRELLILFFISFSAFPIAGAGITVFFNGYLDKSEPSVFKVPIVKKYITVSKNVKHYHIKVRSWRPEERTETLSVSYRDYNSIILNRANVKVVTRKGYYNFEWIVDHQILY
jgi:hypothetical protein